MSSREIEIIYSPQLEENSPVLSNMSGTAPLSPLQTHQHLTHSTAPISAIANTSTFLPRMKKSAISATDLPPHKAPRDISIQYFNSPTTLDVKDIIKEFETKDIFGKNVKRAQRDYCKALSKYGELKLKSQEIKSKDLNGEYIYGTLLLKEIEILKFETFFQIENKYIEFMQTIKDYEDVYNTKTEKNEKGLKVQDEYVQLEELLRQLRFLDVERSKILQLQWPYQVGLFDKIKNFLGLKSDDGVRT